MTLLDDLARIAESQIGTEEDRAHTNKGSDIAKYQASTELDGQGWPWCAAFVDWCVAKYARTYPDRLPDYFLLPKTAAAFGLEDWGREQKGRVFSPYSPLAPQVGDIVVYKFSHCGVVTELIASDPVNFFAVEGNTNPEGGRDGYTVAHRKRSRHEVRSFVRLPQRAPQTEGVPS